MWLLRSRLFFGPDLHHGFAFELFFFFFGSINPPRGRCPPQPAHILTFTLQLWGQHHIVWESRWLFWKVLGFESASGCVVFGVICWFVWGWGCKSRDNFSESWGLNSGCLALWQVPLSNQRSISQVPVCDFNVRFPLKFSLMGTSPVLHHS